MSLYKYEVFYSIVTLGSMSKAAETLNLTHSAVSHIIANLEGELGFPLFTRNRTGITVTSNGERLLLYIKQMLQTNENLKKEVAAINGLHAGTVRIGSFSSVSNMWLPGILAQFHQYHPSIQVELADDGNYDEIERWIDNGLIDFGFVSLPTSKTFDVLLLKKDRLLCVLPPEHALSQTSMIHLHDIAQETFIMPKWGSYNDIGRILQEKGAKLTVKYEITESQTIISMISKGLGISILPEMVLARNTEDIRTVYLDQSYYRKIGIAARSLKNCSPAAKKFIACTKAWLTDHNLLDS